MAQLVPDDIVPSDASRSANRLLSALPSSEWEAIRPHAEFLSLPAGTTLTRANDPLAFVFYPTHGIVSIITTFENGHSLQLSPIGPEGMVGLGVVLNMQPSPYWYMAPFDASGFRVPGEVFQQAFLSLPVLRGQTLEYVGRVLTMAGRTVLCNRFHSVQQRLATWLLVVAEKTRSYTLSVTHDFIAQMIGGPRHAITRALQAFRDAGAIRYKRGLIEILDGVRLRTESCGCPVIS